ncbi:unnamed protein product [Linum tenue]|uniref:Uncharacterized protein n=1 Tax=Linum tenue TaxID=586396 RepID=A0AAV0M684_9ROSI|nr:unnamed protein product [Linum tenue]
MIQSGSSSAPATASTQMGSVQTGLLKLDTGKPRARTGAVPPRVSALTGLCTSIVLL